MTITPTERLIEDQSIDRLFLSTTLHNGKKLELLREKIWLRATEHVKRSIGMCAPFGWRTDAITFKQGIIVDGNQTLLTIHMVLDESLQNSTFITMESRLIPVGQDPKELGNRLLRELQKQVYNLPAAKRWFH